jgi:sporulation protein YlmC with PRC-barrel domain
MAHYGRLKNYRFSSPDEVSDDIRGSTIYGLDDEKIGKIDDVIFDHSSGGIRYVVVDTGGWLSSKKFVIPPDQLRTSARHGNDYEISATKEQIEYFPPYNESDVESHDKWEDYEKRYKAAWHDGPVQHRKGSDHDITPTAAEMPAEPGSIGSQLNARERAELGSRVVPAGSDDVTISNSAMGIGARWLTFEDRLRQRRRDITQSCTTCSVGPASDRSSESAGQERKAI